MSRCPARITSKELAPIHSVKSGILQNACSTRPRVVADLGKKCSYVLTLICSGVAQVCHDDRVVELKGQLEVEEEDGDRQEEEVEEKGEVESKRVRHG